MGCVTCHTCHASMTDFRPILGNPVEVTHVTSPGHVYVSHTKGLARYFMSFFFTDHHFFSTPLSQLLLCLWDPLGPGPFLAQPLSHTPLDFFSCFTTFCNTVHVHPFQVPWAPHDKPSHSHANVCKGVGLKCNLGRNPSLPNISILP